MPLTVPTGSGLDPPSTAFRAVSPNPDIWPYRGIAGSSKAGALLVLCVWESHMVTGMSGGGVLLAQCSWSWILLKGTEQAVLGDEFWLSFCTSAEHHE